MQHFVIVMHRSIHTIAQHTTKGIQNQQSRLLVYKQNLITKDYSSR